MGKCDVLLLRPTHYTYKLATGILPETHNLVFFFIIQKIDDNVTGLHRPTCTFSKTVSQRHSTTLMVGHKNLGGR